MKQEKIVHTVVIKVKAEQGSKRQSVENQFVNLKQQVRLTSAYKLLDSNFFNHTHTPAHHYKV